LLLRARHCLRDPASALITGARGITTAAAISVTITADIAGAITIVRRAAIITVKSYLYPTELPALNRGQFLFWHGVKKGVTNKILSLPLPTVKIWPSKV
jgi:hypothetical protein